MRIVIINDLLLSDEDLIILNSSDEELEMIIYSSLDEEEC